MCGLKKKVRAVIIGAIVQYILPKFERLIVCVCVCVNDQGRFVLTSPGESAQLWFPWHTRVSFEVNEADWLSPSARSGSQTAPSGWTPDNPVNQGD